MFCKWKECEVDELNVQDGHIHLLVWVPPKLSISKLMGAMKGKIGITFQEPSQVETETLLG